MRARNRANLGISANLSVGCVVEYTLVRKPKSTYGTDTC